MISRPCYSFSSVKDFHQLEHNPIGNNSYPCEKATSLTSSDIECLSSKGGVFKWPVFFNGTCSNFGSSSCLVNVYVCMCVWLWAKIKRVYEQLLAQSDGRNENDSSSLPCFVQTLVGKKPDLFMHQYGARRYKQCNQIVARPVCMYILCNQGY